MSAWLSANLSTVIIFAILLAIVIAISVYLINQKKSGKSACGCGCENCALRGGCRGEKE